MANVIGYFLFVIGLAHEKINTSIKYSNADKNALGNSPLERG
jgi:hypothetical protein